MSLRHRTVLAFPILSQLVWPGLAAPAAGADYYVDGRSGSDAAPGTAKAPLRNIYRGIHLAGPGDTIHVLPTTVYGPVYIAVSGTMGAPITLRGQGGPAALTRVLGSGWFGFQVAPGASYVSIVGFDVQATGNRSAIYVSPGTSHVIVSGNYLHDSGGAGIAANGTDYLTVANNVIERNATSGATSCLSGITIYQLRNTDGGTGLHNAVTGNVVTGNTNSPGPGCNDTDGNGIIIDDSRNLQGSAYPAYTAATLVSDNLVYANGGRGIDVFQSDHVTITDNTLWHDNQDVHEASWKPGEIMIQDSGDVRAINNVAVSDGAVSGYNFHTVISVESCSGAPIQINNNLMWSDTGRAANALFDPVAGSHLSTARLQVGAWNTWNRWADPMFERASANPSLADFRLRPTSPGLGLGNLPYTPVADLLGQPALRFPSVGAYEAPGP